MATGSLNGCVNRDEEHSRPLNANQSENENRFAGPLFNPPVYQQRYDAVRNLVRRLQPKKVVDMGCAQCKLLRLLKFENCLEELIGVDVDEIALQSNKHRLEPLLADYIFRRPKPFKIQLMKGSISNPDVSLRNTDLFSCIEVIEHLEEPTLDRVPSCVFGVIRPTVAIFSTPNSEFNVLFPGFSGFRHPDHKFEWNREQFQSWCSGICNLYGYRVEITGVGDPPSNRTDLGYCSQIAVFTRLADVTVSSNEAMDYTNSYELVFECLYPYMEDHRSPEEELSHEAEYYIRLLQRRHGEEVENDTDEDEERRTSSDLNAEGQEENASATPLLLESDPPDTVFVKLDDLMVFNSIRRLASSVEDIRHALTLHSTYELRLHQGSHYAVVNEEEDNILSEEDSLAEDERENYCNGNEQEDWDNETT